MKNLKTIVIGTTLSAESDGIVKAGAAIARATGAKTWLVHAYSLPAFPSELGALDAQWIAEQTEALRQRLLNQIHQAGIDELTGFAADQACLAFGAPYREIIETARRVKADLIVVGASEGGALHRAFLGSTAERVIRKAPCPVLVVRRETALPPSRVLIPVDFSSVSATALRYGLAFLRETGSTPQTEAFFVLNPLEVAGSLQFTPEQIQRFANTELRKFLDENGTAMRAVQGSVMAGYPREEILYALEQRQTDLAILGTHGRSGFDRLMIGSVAAQVLERASCNVLVVPPDTAVKDEQSAEKTADADWSFVSDETVVPA